MSELLRRLHNTYNHLEEWACIVEVLNRLIILQPQIIENYRERGLAQIKNGKHQQAELDLEHYLRQARTSFIHDKDLITKQLRHLKNP